jgi:hypothetical protein
MEGVDFKDIYIGYPGHPAYNDRLLVTDDPVRIIIQKYEMLLFTNKGDILGDPNMGCDLERLLYQTRLSESTIERRINEQIETYIPEIIGIPYTLTVEIVEDPERHQEIMFIDFVIGELSVFTRIG